MQLLNWQAVVRTATSVWALGTLRQRLLSGRARLAALECAPAKDDYGAAGLAHEIHEQDGLHDGLLQGLIWLDMRSRSVKPLWTWMKSSGTQASYKLAECGVLHKRGAPATLQQSDVVFVCVSAKMRLRPRSTMLGLIL